MCFSTCQLHLTSHLHLRARMYLMWSRGPPIEAHHDNNVMDSVQLTKLLLWGGLLVYVPDGGAGSYSAILFLGQKPWVGPSNESWIMFPLKSSKEEGAWKFAFQTSDIGLQTHASNVSLNKNFLGFLRIMFLFSVMCGEAHFTWLLLYYGNPIQTPPAPESLWAAANMGEAIFSHSGVYNPHSIR